VVLYSPVTSLNGAKLLLSKGPPRKVTVEDMSDAVTAPTVLTPHALPMFRDLDPGRGSKRKRDKERQDPRKSRRPELPVTGPGRGGRVGASATQHIVQNLVRDTTRDVDVSRCVSLRGYNFPQLFGALMTMLADQIFFCFFLQPREALLKYADAAEKDPQWTGGESFVSPETAPEGARAITIFCLRVFCMSDCFFFSQHGKPTNRSPCLQKSQRRRRQSSRVQSI
jgi:hypothetical protein